MPSSFTWLQPRIKKVIWTARTSGSASDPYELDDLEGAYGSVAFTGTFGGATIVLEVSNDKVNWFPMLDKFNAAITFTVAGYREFSTSAQWIRPMVTGGAGTSLDATVLMRDPR